MEEAAEKKKSKVGFSVSHPKPVEAVVVIPKNPKQKSSITSDDGDDPAEQSALRPSHSDSELYTNFSEFSGMTAITKRTDWTRLMGDLKTKRGKRKTAREMKFIDAIRRSKAKRRIGRLAPARMFARKLSCLFVGPMFYRHRFRIIIFLEVFVPALIFLFVSWSFTSGISWKKAYSERRAADAFAGAQRGAPKADEDLVIQKFREKFMDRRGRVYMSYAPSTGFTDDLMRKVIEKLGLDGTVNRVLTGNTPHSSVGAAGVATFLEVMERCLLHRLDRNMHNSPVGIEFELEDEDVGLKISRKLKFAIRTFDKTISETLESHPYVQPPRKSGTWYPPYVESGFIGLQLAIQKAFLEIAHERLLVQSTARIQEELQQTTDPAEMMRIMKKFDEHPIVPTDPALPTIEFKLLFTPNYFDKSVRQLISVTICFILCFSYTGLSYFIVRQFVIEGQSGIKDYLSLHSMGKYLHWVIYFFHTLIFRTITALGITGTLYINFGQGAIFAHSNPFILYMIIFFHLMSLSSFNFFIGTFLTSVIFSGIVSVSCCFFSFVFPYCLHRVGLMSNTVNLVLALIFPNWALWNAILEVVDYETDGVGVNWTNLQVLTSVKHQLAYVQCILIFVGGNIFYFLVAMIRDLRRGRTGTNHRPWWTRFERRGEPRRSTISPTAESDEDGTSTPAVIYERPEASRKCFVKIRNLSHTYGQHKLVLDSITLDVVNGEILTILGHADSGKSTLLQCLAGIVKPTTGTVVIHEMDLYEEKSKAREFIGYCPQEVVLFNVLPVQEHLVLCYKLRGLSTKEAKHFADGLMELLRITDVKKFVPSALTQDERRRLAIALCLVDKPSIILLDEPTNGMEPLARHEIWTILKGLKSEGHTIVMTTSMMDEAEFLADRVALLAHGKLVCFGTPKFLEEKYDVGYHLRITPNPAKFSLDAFQTFASTHFGGPLPEAPEKTVFDQRNFLLVLPPRQAENYAGFFDGLDVSKESLGVLDYGAQALNLADIFIKISEAVSLGKNQPTDVYIRNSSTLRPERSNLWGEVPLVADTAPPTRMTQFKAMIHKLRLYGVGAKSNLILEIVVPCFLIWLTVWHTHSFITPPSTPVEREFTLSTFPLARVLVKVEGLTADEMKWKATLDRILGTQLEDLIASNEPIEEVIKRDMKLERDRQQFTLDKRMMAIQMSDQDFDAYYSTGSLHSPPLILGIIGNLLLRGVTNKFEGTEQDSYSVIAGNTPLPTVFESDFALSCGLTCLMFGLIISLCMGFFITLLMTFPVLERATGMKQLQFMSGLHCLIYWLAYYAYHFCLSLVLTLLVVFIFIADAKGIYTSGPAFGTLLLIVGLFLCWSGIPWVYYLTTVIPLSLDGPLMGFTIHVAFGFIPTLILETGLSGSTNGMAVFFKYFFHLFPPHTLTSAISIFFDIVSKRGTCRSLPDVIQKMCSEEKGVGGGGTRYTIDKQYIYEYMIKHDTNLATCCEKICRPTNACAPTTPFFDLDSDGGHQPRLLACVIAFILQGFLYWGLVLLLESRVVSDYWHNLVLRFLRKRIEERDEKEGEDIRKEREAVKVIVQNGKCSGETLLVCQGLTKSYTEHMIINDVNINLRRNEIVGLLGGTGCGKSVVIKMLAGEVIPTRGTVLLDSINLHKDRREFLRRVSYCHQEDALFETFTGNQMMELMGRLRGLSPAEIRRNAKQWLHILGLGEAGNDKCSEYSKSMRRRLCAAMTLIGGNSILLLDEPTRGLDAMAKLRFWSVIRELASRGAGIIFTSANVTECQLYATKLFVLSEGNVQCIGPPEQLRTRFSRGFTFLIRIRFEVLTPLEIVSTQIGRINDLKKTVEKKFKRAILRDEQGNLLLYFITGTTLTWGKLFALAEEIKGEHDNMVASYCISQATLDDVFVLLTNRFQDMDLSRNMRSTFPGEMSQAEAETEALQAAGGHQN